MKPTPPKQFDVLGLGCVALDDVLHVPSFPAPDEKLKVVRREQHFGGLTGMALVAAARLGPCAAYAGCLGDDEASRLIEANFIRENVNVSHAPRPPGAAAIRSTVIVAQDTASRTILFQADGITGAHPSLPDEAVITSSRVLLIDHYGMPGNLRAARLARAAGAAVVADFEDDRDPLFPEVLALVDHLILGEALARRITGQSDPAQAAVALWRPDRAAVVVTCGERGCWSVMASDPSSMPSPRHQPAFAVIARDTTGCGDVFHGAYAASLARGDAPDNRLNVAAAAAALKASEGIIPDRTAVERFLAAQPSRSIHPLEHVNP
ncbi:MAG: PfkB family carbohydrate kinase [Tepidisphaeraceae bacterium]